ncbi:tetratricopeptide repeat protein, partial [Halalkalibacterium halodurans]|uniref:tetratricopeptide repeat protein n=1 Tax=Halalkalibacterium halodurans TaxID=86665 RepID=UPI002E218225|nr:tetratricopeptide repeat protein [Halalkalibacterium halodurans]
MGLFDFLFKSNKPKTVKKETRQISTLDINQTLLLAEENKYVNDDLAKQLYAHAYEITQNNIIDRHFLYNQLIDYYYGLRDKEEDALTICKKFCIESIAHTSNFLKEDEKQHNRLYKDSREKRDYIAPRIPAFQRLAIIYENENEFDKAVEVCQKALDLNLKDGT